MININSLLINDFLTIKDAIRIIDAGMVQIGFVVDSQKVLLGTITDGDIRRSLLRGNNLESNVTNAMNKKFYSLPSSSSENKALMMMRDLTIHQIPGLDCDGRVVRLFIQREMLERHVKKNPVILMAGGQGKRLLPMTKDCPKPMLKINGKPILEIIIEQCVESGFREFYISVNYLKEKIINYFGNGENWGINIRYLEENSPTGTAGSLCLISEKIEDSMLVMNGDILTEVDFDSLIKFHRENNSSATICVRNKKTEIPYGIVTSENKHFTSIQEKPVLSHSINAGIYILEPSMINYLKNTSSAVDMPSLIQTGKANGESIFVFPIKEYWLDIGHAKTFEQACYEWNQ
jgi:dTDP-glucose pyrophosphorylase